MSRKSNFEWKQSTSYTIGKKKKEVTKTKQQVLQSELKKYNKKIDNMLQAGYSPLAVPKKKTLRELKKNITTATDYNRELAGIKRIHRKNAFDIISNDKGAEITRYQLNETMRHVRQVNKEIRKQREWYESLDVTVKGKKQGIKNKDIPQTDKYRYEEKKFDFEKKTKKDLEKFFEMVDGMLDKGYRNRTDEQWIDNYKKSTFNKTSDEDAKYIKKLMGKLTQKQIIEVFYSDRNASINVYYEPTDDYTEMVDNVKETWEKAVYDYTGQKYGSLLDEESDE